jgi:HlyD family secretion protein
MSESKPIRFAQSLRRTQWIGFAIVGLLVLGIGGWAVATEIAGAIIASGQVAVRSNAKKVQHLDGGIISELNVQNGDRVAAGDLLARLDETEIRATLEIIDAQYVENLVLKARLKAERDKVADLVAPAELEPFSGRNDLALILASERRLLASRLEGLTGKQNQLKEQVAQNERQIEGLEAQLTASEKGAEIASNELEDLRGLEAKGLVQKSRVLALEREMAGLEGERGRLIAEIARLKGEIGEIELRIIQIEDDWRSEILSRLAEVRTKIASLRQQRLAAAARLERLDIVAPLDGFIHELAVHSTGSVIGAGEPLMLIVPEGEALVIRAQVRPQDIDSVAVGQPARIRLTAFNQRTTPELTGEVITVGADLSVDPATRASYFLVDVAIPPHDPEDLGGEDLRPGMPAEVFIQTGSRTAISYLLNPLTEQVGRMWRE